MIVDSGTDEHREMTGRFLESIGAVGAMITLIGDRVMAAPVARNLGAEHCTGEYLAFLDDDDEWYPDKSSSQLAVSKDDPAIIYSPYIEEIDGVSSEYNWSPASYPEILARNLIGSTSFPLIHKEVFDDIGGFDPDFRTNQEWDLWIRILRKHNCAYSQDLAGKKYDVGGLSADASSRREGWKMLFRKHRSEYSEYKQQHKEAAKLFYGDMCNRRNYCGIVKSLIENLR